MIRPSKRRSRSRRRRRFGCAGSSRTATIEPVPSRCLSPSRLPERFVLTTHFPPDDRSVGYERGNAISRAWDNATTDAAMEVADYVSAQRVELAGVNERAEVRSPNSPAFAISGGATGDEDRTPDTAEQRARKARRVLCRSFVERAFRRPLTSDEEEFFIERQFAEAKDEETAVKRVVLLALKSPRFLYREMGAGGFGVQGSGVRDGSRRLWRRFAAVVWAVGFAAG